MPQPSHLMAQASSKSGAFHSATPYLIFDGTAASAIAFYCDVFAGTELPGRLTDPAGRVLDAAILIGDSVIRVGDEAPWRDCEEPADAGRRIVIRSPLRHRCGRGDRAGCGTRRENPVAHQGSILWGPLGKHRRSIRTGLDYWHTQGRSVAGRDPPAVHRLSSRFISVYKAAKLQILQLRKRRLLPAWSKLVKLFNKPDLPAYSVGQDRLNSRPSSDCPLCTLDPATDEIAALVRDFVGSPGGLQARRPG
jgi:hypothetical protein